MSNVRNVNSGRVDSALIQADIASWAFKGERMFGGEGYVAGNVAERFHRDVRLFRLYEGTTQIQQVIIARNMIREVED